MLVSEKMDFYDRSQKARELCIETFKLPKHYIERTYFDEGMNAIVVCVYPCYKCYFDADTLEYKICLKEIYRA